MSGARRRSPSSALLVSNTLQLKLDLVRQVASVIFDYWAASMPPELTAPGAAHSDTVNAAAIATIASAADSPWRARRSECSSSRRHDIHREGVVESPSTHGGPVTT